MPIIDMYQEAVLDVIKWEGPIRRGDIEEKTGLSRTIVHEALSRLMEAGKVSKVISRTHDRGRPRTYYYWEGHNPCRKCAFRENHDDYANIHCADCVLGDLKWFFHEEHLKDWKKRYVKDES